MEYIRGDDQFFVFQFWPEIPSSYVDGENADAEMIAINGMPATVVKEGDKIRMVLQKASAQYTLHGSVTEEEAKHILESIK